MQKEWPLISWTIAVQPNHDREPDQLASIAVSRDEIASRSRPTGPANRRPSSSSTEGSKQPWLLWALLVICLIAVGYLFVQNQKLQTQADRQLAAIAKLQSMLSNTDEQANLSLEALKILVKEQEHEIRKLWDLSNKRNKVDIAKQKERMDDQSKLITRHSGKISQMDKALDAQAKSVKTASEQVANMEKTLEGTRFEFQSSLEKSQNDIDSLKKSIPKSLAKDVNALEKQVKSQAKSIKAIDATRLQHNKRLKSLEAELNKLKAAGAAPQ